MVGEEQARDCAVLVGPRYREAWRGECGAAHEQLPISMRMKIASKSLHNRIWPIAMHCDGSKVSQLNCKIFLMLNIANFNLNEWYLSEFGLKVARRWQKILSLN